MKVLKMKENKQEGQTSCEAGIARRWKMKKRRRKAGKKGTNGRAVGGGAKIGGNRGKKKDRRKLLAKGT